MKLTRTAIVTRMHLNITKLRQLIREEVESLLDDQEFGPQNRPDQNVSGFEGFRGYVADTAHGAGAHPGLVDTLRTCDVGHPAHDSLWNAWNMVEPECGGVKDGIPYAQMGEILWPYADGLARDLVGLHTPDDGSTVDPEVFAGQFLGALGVDSGNQVSASPFSSDTDPLADLDGDAAFDDIAAIGASEDMDDTALFGSEVDDIGAEFEETPDVDDLMLMNGEPAGEGEAMVASEFDLDDDGSEVDFGGDAELDDLLSDDDWDSEESVDDDGADFEEASRNTYLDPLGHDAEPLDDDEEDEDEEDASRDNKHN